METPFTYDIMVRGYELDSFNHVNNAVHLNYMEQARWDIAQKLGLLDHFRENQCFLVVVETNIRYKQELRMSDQVEIQTTIRKEGPFLLFLHKLIKKENGALASKAKVKTLLVDSQRNPLDLPQEIDKWFYGK